MQTAQRRRRRWAIAASAVAHAAVLVAVLAYRPHLTRPVELAAGPAETVIPVLMMPHSHAARQAPPRPSAVAPPLARSAPATSRAVAAPPTSQAQTQTAKVDPGPPAAAELGAGPPAAADLALALRHGAAGCASAAAVGMSREERERCEDHLALGAKSAPVMALAMEPRTRAYYDAVIKAKAPDKPWTPNRAIGALNRFDPEPRVSSSGDHLPGVGCVVPFGLPKMTAKEKQALKKRTLPHALWLGPCFIEPPKGSLDPEIDIPVP